MKEFKVATFKVTSNIDKATANVEEVLNKMTSEGWDFVQKDGGFLIFSREK